MSGKGVPPHSREGLSSGHDEARKPPGLHDSDDAERPVTFKHEDLEQPHSRESSPAATRDNRSSSIDGYQFKNRLSKACDSCSIRKVKVGYYRVLILSLCHSYRRDLHQKFTMKRVRTFIGLYTYAVSRFTKRARLVSKRSSSLPKLFVDGLNM